MAQGQNIENQPIASQYGVFKVPATQMGSYSFTPGSCQQAAGNRNFAAFSNGTPVKIVDASPSLTEIVTPSSVYINDSQCVINVAPVNTHVPPFYLTSGTGGLQEALINSTNISGANTIVLDTLWHQLVGSSAASVIAAAKGSTTLGLVDITTTPYTWYQWGGSAYAAVSLGGGTIPATNTLLKGNGTVGVSVPASSSDVATLLNSTPQVIVGAELNSDIFVDTIAQANCGSRINYAANTVLAGSYGKMTMTTGCGAISTPVTLGANQHLYVRPGTYTVSALITLGANSSIECDPASDAPATNYGSCYFTELAGSNLGTMFLLSGTNSALVNVTVDGNAPGNSTAGSNISITGLRARVDHVTSQRAEGAGISVSGTSNSAAAAKLDHVMILGNIGDGVTCSVASDLSIGGQSEIENNGGNGITLTNCGGSRVTYNDISGNTLDGVLISGSSTAAVSAYNNLITANFFSQNGHNDIEIQGWDSTHATYSSLSNGIDANIFQGSSLHAAGNTYDAVHVQDSGFNTIDDNVVQDPFGSTFQFKTGVEIISVHGELGDVVSGNNIQTTGTPITSVPDTSLGANSLNGSAGAPTLPNGTTATTQGSCASNTDIATGAYVANCASSSQKVIYASKISGVTAGVAVIPGSTASGCATSDTQLNAAISGGNVDLEVDSGFCLAAPLVLASNTTVHCVAQEFGFIMAQNSNNNTIINANQVAPTTVSSTTHGYLISGIVDQDITVSGCTINSNSTNAVTEATHRYQNNTSTGQALMGVQMLGIKNFKLIGNLIYDTPTWGVLVSNAIDVLIQGNRRKSPTPLVQLKNDDGFDMIGPINNVTLSNNYSQTGDDANCICADGVQDASNSGDTTYYPHYHPIPFRNGPVTNVLEDGLFCDASINCIDALSTTELIDRVQINNVNGTVNSIPFRVTRYGGLGGAGLGNVGSLGVSNWNVQPTQSGGVFTLDDHFDLDVNANNLTFSNIVEDNPVDGYPIFYQRSGTIKNLNINGIEVNNTTGAAAPYVLQTAAGTSNPTISNVSWTSNGSGFLLGGASVPTTVTVSNYAGPNAVLAAGYAPSFQNGDAFTNTYPTVATIYINTLFNEASSGTALAGTTPATCINGCTGTWTAASGGPTSGAFAYSTSSATLAGSCASGGTYVSCPVYINTGHANYTMRVTVSQFDSDNPQGLRFIVRYTNGSNFVEFAQTPSNGTWAIYDIVSGGATLINSGALGNSTGQWTVIMSGTTATLKNPAGTTLTGTISGSNTSDDVAVDSDLATPPSSPTIITALSVKSN